MPQFPPVSALVLTVLMAAGIANGSDGPGPVESSALLLGFVENHCLECHDPGARKADLDLDALLSDPVSAHPETWETVVRRLESREMPPPDRRDRRDRPDDDAYRAAVAQLTEWLDSAAARHPNPGRTETIRRLTRTEYRNAVRDLFAIEVDVAELLPKDESAQGFDNITVGELTPTLLGRYVSAAQKISRLVVGRDPGSAQLRIVRLPADRTQERHLEGLPLGTRGGALIDHVFPITGEYEIEVRLARDRNEHVEGLRGTHDLHILVDRRKLADFTVKPPKDKDHSKVDTHLKARLKIEGGPRAIGVTFVKNSTSLSENRVQPYAAQFNMHRHPRSTPAVFQISISGPFQSGGEGKTDIDQPRPGLNEHSEAAAKAYLSSVLRRAYRRPVTAADLERPMRFFHESVKSEGFKAGLEMALSSILVSPGFLFRVEIDPGGLEPGAVYAVDDIALASRLSFFLWSSIPDEKLLAVAEAGRLSKPNVLARQARRMLKDPKATALATNFANQWLHLRNLDSATRNLRLYPDFDDNLRQSFRRETEFLFEDLVREDRPVHELLRSGYTYLNERLARHYGIPNIRGSRFRKVYLDGDHHRGGLLRHGSILTVTSYANRTSPVIRGNWILENILGTPTPPPPPEVPVLDDSVVAASLPIRERLARHSSDKSCAVCHDRIDPLGFALENYDAVGRWREHVDGETIDASGGFSDGREFAGPAALEDALLEKPGLFARSLTEKLLTFALGRGMESHDAPAVRAILREAREEDFRFSAIIAGIVISPPFTHRSVQ